MQDVQGLGIRGNICHNKLIFVPIAQDQEKSQRKSNIKKVKTKNPNSNDFRQLQMSIKYVFLPLKINFLFLN